MFDNNRMTTSECIKVLSDIYEHSKCESCMYDYDKDCSKYGSYGCKTLQAIYRAIKALKKVGIVEERPKAEWCGEYLGGYKKCSNCGARKKDWTRFCPECGARMEGENQ